MFEWLLEQTLLSSVLIILLVMAKVTVSRQVSALTNYAAWSIVPVTIYLTSFIDVGAIAPELIKYTVSVDASSRQIAELFEYSDLALYVWFVGIALLSGALLYSYFRFSQRQALSQQSYKELRFSEQSYKVKITRSRRSPFVVGFITPVIVIPEDFHSRYSVNQQALILSHEQTHQKRGDLWWNLLAQLIVMLFWFNPLSWMAYKYFRQAQELACDEAVIAGKTCSLKAEYANALLCTSTPKEISPNLIHYGDKSMLKQRLNNVMHPSPGKPWKNIFAFAVLSVVTATATLATAGDHASSGISAVPLKRFEPVYPEHASQKGIEGSVVLQFDIETDGSVTNVNVVESNPEGVFNRSAKIALRKWVYEPPHAKMSDVLVQLDFVLSPQSSELSIKNHRNDNELVIVENHH